MEVDNAQSAGEATAFALADGADWIAYDWALILAATSDLDSAGDGEQG